MLDSDEDGMSDVWEQKFSGQSLAPGDDEDGDGMTNLEESLAGTDPFSYASALAVTSSNYLNFSNVIEWTGKTGVHYQVEKSTTMAGNWSNMGSMRLGHGGTLSVAEPAGHVQRCFYRVKVIGSEKFAGLPSEAETIVGTRDTDKDGISDLDEMRFGTDPFDPQSQLPTITFTQGKSMNLSWITVEGKYYRVQSSNSPVGPWQDVNGLHLGTGGVVTSAVTFHSGVFEYVRVVVEDRDSDEDGVTDWEEGLLGLEPEIEKTDPWGAGDAAQATVMLASPSTLNVRASSAVANISTMENGSFEVTRTGGVAALNVQYTISGNATPGSDYQPLTGTVTIPFGENSVVIPVIPQASSTLSLSNSVIVTLQNSGSYDLGAQISQQINVIKEVAINVMDYGAVGDGVVDDTAALETAIAALESSSQHNTLFFPAGSYRLTTSKGDSSTPNGSYRILKLGSTQALTGRDLIFKGEAGTVLYSDIGSSRAHVVLALASFRSLRFEKMRIEQSPSLLWPKNGTEPNGSDGVAIVNVDARKVESIYFNDCVFFNCHRSASIYGMGYNLRAKCGRVNFTNSQFLNPYGSNTQNGAAAWGGGQQVYLSPWIDIALYENCLFDGGSEDMTDTSLTGGGRMKDGCHFGSPLNLIFRNNVVKRMSVEAVFHTNDVTLLGVTATDFSIPPADGFSTVDVNVSSLPSTWTVGDQIVIRQPFVPGSVASNNHFIIVAFDAGNSMLTLKNEGHPDNANEGTFITSGKKVYRDHEPEPPVSVFENNYLVGTLPPGGNAFPERAGIVIGSRALIRNNVIVDFTTGVLSYDEVHTPDYPASTGSITKDNIIITKNRYVEGGVDAKGLYLSAGGHYVLNNLIICPVSYRSFGIVQIDKGINVMNNKIGCETIIRNGYTSINRSVGIALNNTASKLLASDNTTMGFDVGIGPRQANQWRTFYVREHYSFHDVLPLDPVGLTEEP